MSKIITINLPQGTNEQNEPLEDKTFAIECDDTSEQQAIQIKEFIQKNLLMFSDLFKDLDKISFISSNEDSTLYISSMSDFKEYISKLIPEFMEKVNQQVDEISRKEYEAMLLRILLIDLYRESGLNVEIPFADEKFAQNVAATSAIAAVLYYTEKNSADDFLNYLFDQSLEEKQNILLWLNDKNVFNLLNQLLHEQYQRLIKFDGESDARDDLLHQHLDEIIGIIDSDFENTPINSNASNFSFSPLSPEQLDELCIEFFSNIDPTGKWLEKYNRYKQDQIIYSENDPTNPIEWCNFCDEDGKYVIISPLTGTITDFRDLVHEITHIISLEQLADGEEIPPSLLEYPAIFMELQAIKFLRKKGYCQEELDALYTERVNWTAANIFTISPLLKILSRKLKNNEVSFKSEQEYSLSVIGNIDLTELSEADRQLLLYYYPLSEEDITAKCNEYIELLILHPDVIVREYPYTIGKYLAVKTMDKEKEDPSTLPKVLSIVENLKNESPTDVIKKLGLAAEQLSPQEPPKHYVKVEN